MVYTIAMAKAARAIVIEDGKLLVMYRNKHGSEYYTLVGGQVADGETTERALAREIREETGLQVTGAQLVYTEEHPAPYNEQYIYICRVAPHADVAIQEWSEEGQMNRLNANIHKPMWVSAAAFGGLPFRTPKLQAAIINGLRKGFPVQPVDLTNANLVIDTKQHSKLSNLLGKARRNK